MAAELLESYQWLCNQYCMKAVLLLLLAVGTAAAPHVNFLRAASSTASPHMQRPSSARFLCRITAQSLLVRHFACHRFAYALLGTAVPGSAT